MTNPERKALGKTQSAGLIGLVIGLLIGVAVGYLIWGVDSGPANPEDQAGSEDDSAAALVADGLALQIAGQTEQAKAKYNEALRVSPGDKFALYNLGVIEQSASNPSGSIPFYRQALASDPTFASARYNLALALRDTGDTTGAIAELETVLSADPNGIGTLVNLGNLLIASGETARGQELLDRAQALDDANQ